MMKGIIKIGIAGTTGITGIRASSKIVSLVLLFAFMSLSLKAQSKDVPFNDKELLKFELRYKYGLVMVKGGSAFFAIDESSYQNKAAYKATLSFRTSSFFDGLFQVRDTLTSYMSKDKLEPLYNYRSVNEGSTHYTEKLQFLTFGKENSSARIIREKEGGRIVLDTTHYSNNIAYDMTNLFLFIRTLDYESLKMGDTFRLSAFVGKSKADIVVRCKGQHLLERSKTHKYKTIKFDVDIVDDAFSESKNAMELWISDDGNRIPVKMKAKLKIGAVEVYLTSTKNLKHPFTAEFNIKNQ